MMSGIKETVEAIKNGQEVSTKQLFEVVNAYGLTMLSLNKNGKTILSMQLNKLEICGDAYEFSQECSTDSNMYIINQADIISSHGKYKEDVDTIFITSELSGGEKLNLMIVHASDSLKRTWVEDFCETDVYDIQEFLGSVIEDDTPWYCVAVKITDIFGFSFKAANSARIYVDALSEDWKLHISDEFNVFEIPVVDDGCNAFYKKETDSSMEMIIKPYGQPFMEIEMLFFRKNQ